jgi:8-oxo-dGTP pyrophosphatase MutT (NUDIX family)
MVTRQQVVEALRLEDFDVWSAQRQMIPDPRPRTRPPERAGNPREGAVLLLLYCDQGELSLVLTRRPDTLKDHAGQISLPGGRQDMGESLGETALRETCEEVGICDGHIQLLGQLTTIYIPPTDFHVHPFVGWYEGRPAFRLNPLEVAELIPVALLQLRHPDIRRQEMWTLRGMEIEVPFFQVGEHKVWGATAIILAEFLGRLEQVTGDDLFLAE